jgi:hypothetical protein
LPEDEQRENLTLLKVRPEPERLVIKKNTFFHRNLKCPEIKAALIAVNEKIYMLAIAATKLWRNIPELM